MLCGLMSSGRQPETWCDAVIELLGEDAITDAQTVDTFADAVAVGLQAEDLSFMPLLPDERAELGERLEQLGLWCSGFCAGLGLVRSAIRSCADEHRELLDDLAAIAQIECRVTMAATERPAKASATTWS